MRILGCVKEVNELELVISLPNGLQGFVQVTEICDAYTQKLNKQVAQEEPLEVRGVWVKLAPGIRIEMLRKENASAMETIGFFVFRIYFVLVCTCHITHGGQRGQPVRFGSLFPPCGFLGANIGPQACSASILTAHPTC